MQISHYLPRTLPERLKGLGTLALDLRWSWNHGADELWRTVDPDLWDATANPWLIIESVADERLVALANDAEFLSMLETQLEERDAHFRSQTWFSRNHEQSFRGQIAYFSMEFGLSEALPIYAGGLGVLAGDYLKTACDLGVPAVGVGLLYQEGYFRQVIDASGAQIEHYPYNDPTMLPVVPLRDDDGEWVRIKIDLPGRTLRLRTWIATVGRRSLFLLDSNDLLNDAADRGITSQLYGGGPELRLEQEIVLGIGGWRLLERLGLDCTVCHLNEGHAAFAVLERAWAYMNRSGEPFRVALRATRTGNLFTTHTPVPAGFDRFDPTLFGLYFNDYAERLGIGLEALLALGRREPARASEPFNMAYLAIRGAGAVNGVSRLHGEVSRRIFEPLFPRWPRAEVPIGHVTNGVHTPTWDSASADKLWTRACGKARWRGQLESVEENLREVDDGALWQLRCSGRRRLVEFLNARRADQSGRRQATLQQRFAEVVLDPDILTVGFGRRFVEYKRNNLLLRDPARLARLLASRDRPVQLVIAGKAHPQDALGKRMLRDWHNFVERPELKGRVVLVEDYDMIVAGELVQGVDVWLNTPRRPWEACGTSGMKVLVNGGLNLSEREGWWAEAYDAGVGWALGDGREPADPETCDAHDADELYRLLESEVVPAFYSRDEDGLPREWIAKMRESMACLTTQFSCNRMMREYVERYYVPLAESVGTRDVAMAQRLEEWHGQLERSWSSIHFGIVSATPTAEGHRFDVQVYLYQLPADAVRVELYANPLQPGPPERHVLTRGAPLQGASNAYAYSGIITSDRPAADYTPRIVPMHDTAAIPLEASHILWFR
jgi:glycogen phosphorylase